MPRWRSSIVAAVGDFRRFPRPEQLVSCLGLNPRVRQSGGQPMTCGLTACSSLTITPDQRDAIYELVMNHLSGIEDVWMAVEQRDFATAYRLGRLFAEDLRLLEDLGQSISVDGGSSVHRSAAAFPFGGACEAKKDMTGPQAGPGVSTRS